MVKKIEIECKKLLVRVSLLFRHVVTANCASFNIINTSIALIFNRYFLFYFCVWWFLHVTYRCVRVGLYLISCVDCYVRCTPPPLSLSHLRFLSSTKNKHTIKKIMLFKNVLWVWNFYVLYKL